MSGDASGKPFQSTKHPHLPPDRVQVSLLRPLSQPALWQLAMAYRDEDPEFSQALSARLLELGYDPLRSLASTLEAVDGQPTMSGGKA